MGNELKSEKYEGFAACPTCHQYSHSIGDDQLTMAYRHFQSMFSHRGDGIPTQRVFDDQTRDAAQVLMEAATRPADQVTPTELVGAAKALISALDYKEIGDKVAEAGGTHWDDIQCAATDLADAIAALKEKTDD